MNIEGIRKASNVQNIGNVKGSSGLNDLSTPNKINISEQAQYMDKLSEMPAIRQEKVDAIKAQIQEGTYLDEAKLEEAMENMLEDLL